MIPFYAQVDLDDSTADSYDSMSLSDKASAKQSAYAKLDDDGVKKAKEKAKKLAEEVLKKLRTEKTLTSLLRSTAGISVLKILQQDIISIKIRLDILKSL